MKKIINKAASKGQTLAYQRVHEGAFFIKDTHTHKREKKRGDKRAAASLLKVGELVHVVDGEGVLIEHVGQRLFFQGKLLSASNTHKLVVSPRRTGTLLPLILQVTTKPAGFLLHLLAHGHHRHLVSSASIAFSRVPLPIISETFPKQEGCCAVWISLACFLLLLLFVVVLVG